VVCRKILSSSKVVIDLFKKINSERENLLEGRGSCNFFGISQQGVAGEMLCYHTEAQGKVRGSELPGIVECNCCHTSRAVYRESIFMSQKGTVFTVAHKVIEINKEQTFKKDYPSTPHSVLCQREENFLITTLSLFFFFFAVASLSVVGLFCCCCCCCLFVCIFI